MLRSVAWGGRQWRDRLQSDGPAPKTEPLSDLEVQDRLHRMAFELEHLKGQTTPGETALRAAHRALMLFLAALIAVGEKPPPPSQI